MIPANYARLIAREHPFTENILAEFGLSVELGSDEEKLPLAEFLAFLERLDSGQLSPGWHLDFASRTADHFHGPLSFAMMSAPTIGDGLRVFAKYVGIRAPYLHGSIREVENRLFVVFKISANIQTALVVLTEIPLRIAHDYVAMMGNVNPAAAQIFLTYPQAPNRTYYASEFSCRVRFQADENALSIPSPWCAIPNSQYDETVWTNAIARCDEVLASVQPASMVERTRAHLAAILVREPAKVSIDDTARALGISVRTLIRHLRSHGTSFSALRDDARRALAIKLLRRPSFTVEQTANALGFSDASSFSRAFTSWYGMAPGKFRRTKL